MLFYIGSIINGPKVYEKSSILFYKLCLMIKTLGIMKINGRQRVINSLMRFKSSTVLIDIFNIFGTRFQVK